MVCLDEADFICVTEKDIPLIAKYLDIAQIEESNHNLVNMFLWREQYPLWQYHTEEYMLLLGIHKGKLFCYMPLCKKEFFEEAILKAKSIFDKHHVPFELSCFTKDRLELLQNILPKCSVTVECEAADYVYEGEKMRTLSGKKLQKRRNNYNHFVSLYEGHYTFSEMSKDDIPELKEYMKQWRVDRTEEYLNYEAEGVENVLNLFGVLPYRGGVIRIDGEIKAFIIGSMTSKRMVQINIEKADPTIRGLYQAIEKLYLEQFYPDVQWVNREDDMGIDSLRQAKQALHPAYMIDKYRIKEHGTT
ncbi:MAG: DUF2156 domain-containing protein [Erysipelotrichaceae bacterium]